MQAYTLDGSPITRIAIRLDDGEPGLPTYYKPLPRQDGRYDPIAGMRPTINGNWTPILEAEDDKGNVACASGASKVKVMQ